MTLQLMSRCSACFRILEDAPEVILQAEIRGDDLVLITVSLAPDPHTSNLASFAVFPHRRTSTLPQSSSLEVNKY